MFPVRTVALSLAVFAGTAFSQNTSPDKDSQPQKPAAQQNTAAPLQPQTKVLIPESDAAAANSAAAIGMDGSWKLVNVSANSARRCDFGC